MSFQFRSSFRIYDWLEMIGFARSSEDTDHSAFCAQLVPEIHTREGHITVPTRSSKVLSSATFFQVKGTLLARSRPNFRAFVDACYSVVFYSKSLYLSRRTLKVMLQVKQRDLCGLV